MVALTKYDYTTDYAEFAIDSASELSKLPTTSRGGTDELAGLNHPIKGGTAYTTDGKLDIYTLSGDGTWNLSSAGGGGTAETTTYDNTSSGLDATNVQDAIDELAGGSGGSSWIENIPEMHRDIFRGQSLGSTVTAAQLAAIEDGSFEGLYVGDYWTIPTTVDGTTKDVKYRIIDVDYFLNRGNASTKVTAHHLVIMPDDSIATAPYNTTAAQVFFKTSSLYTTTLPAINTTLTDIFGNNLLEHTIPVEASGALFGREWATLKADIPSMSQVIGSTIYINSIVKDTGNTQPLFALFALCPRFLTSESASIWWLRDLYAAEGSSMQAQVMGNGGMLAYMNFTTPEGVRPYFLLGVPSGT